MFGLLGDLTIALKIVGFLILFRWVAGNIENKLLATLVLLVAAYYLLFMEWTLFGTFVVVFIIIAMTGITGFVQDLVFQYGSVREREEQQAAILAYMRRR